MFETADKTRQQLCSYFDKNHHAESLTHLNWQIHNDFKNMFSRKNMGGHLTGSGLVINEHGEFLLIMHPYLKNWLQPGGHSEGIDISLSDTAKTEVFEETGYGVELLRPEILDLDTHFIPANPKKQEDAHYHHDAIFLFKTTHFDPTHREFGDDAIRWFKLGASTVRVYAEFENNRRLLRVLNKLAMLHRIDPDIRALW